MKAKSILPVMTWVLSLGLGGSAIAATVLQTVPNADTAHPSGTIQGDLWGFRGAAGQTISLSVDTRDDNGDATSNLDPVLLLIRPDGTLFAFADDEVSCSRPPVCGFACPSIGPVTLDATGSWRIAVQDFNTATTTDTQCTGGAYNLTVIEKTPSLVTDDGEVPNPAAADAAATLRSLTK